jgi:hypothetical protein
MRDQCTTGQERYASGAGCRGPMEGSMDTASLRLAVRLAAGAYAQHSGRRVSVHVALPMTTRAPGPAATDPGALSDSCGTGGSLIPRRVPLLVNRKADQACSHEEQTGNGEREFAVSWWDRLCGTYRPQPALGQMGMDFGLSDERAPLNLGQLLLLPFGGSAGGSTYAGSRLVRAQGGEAV